MIILLYSRQLSDSWENPDGLSVGTAAETFQDDRFMAACIQVFAHPRLTLGEIVQRCRIEERSLLLRLS